VSFIVVYDACVLYPASLRDLLIRLAAKRVVQARWTQAILDEYVDALLERQPELERARLARTCELMNRAVPEALVQGYDQVMEALALPDPDDRHVLAAAIVSGAQVIVTQNLRDFPNEVLSPHGIEALHPDEFVLDTLDLAPGAVCEALAEQSANLKNPPMSRDDLLERLERVGLARSVARIRELLGA